MTSRSSKPALPGHEGGARSRETGVFHPISVAVLSRAKFTFGYALGSHPSR